MGPRLQKKKSHFLQALHVCLSKWSPVESKSQLPAPQFQSWNDSRPLWPKCQWVNAVLGARWNNSLLSASTTSTGNQLTCRREELKPDSHPSVELFLDLLPVFYHQMAWILLKGINHSVTFCCGFDTCKRRPVSARATSGDYKENTPSQ